MEIINGNKHAHVDVSTVLDVDGREHLVVVAKATYRIPENDQPARPVQPQPLIMSDIHVGAPGASASLYEADFVLRKSKCDVLFDAYAYAPGLTPVTNVEVRATVGDMRKGVRVLGDRVWQKKLLGVKPGEPLPFTRMPLHYGLAFGGSQEYEKNGERVQDTYRANPVGVGYGKSARAMENRPMPNLESIDEPITHPDKQYAAHALSAISRFSLPRSDLAGTYDEQWRDEVFPFLPHDFDERYYQCAPEDQQIPFPRGGEPVELINMMPQRPHIRFRLPRLNQMPIRILATDYLVHEPEVHVDTLYFEPDESRFSVVWRASIRLERRIQEIQAIAVGAICRQWWSAKVRGAAGCSGCAGKRDTRKAPDDCEEDIVLVDRT